MQKIKTKVLHSWLEKNLTSAEMSFLMYVSHYQNEAGTAIGIYYREVCRTLEISVQTFYNLLESLQKKEIISIQRVSDIDYDVTILGNDFSDQNYQEGYVNTNRRVFYTKDFLTLKAPEKLMLVELMRAAYCNNGRFIIEKGKFYEKYIKIFSVAKRAVRGYLGSLRKFFQIVLLHGKYIIVPDRNMFEKADQTEAVIYAQKVVQAGCRRQRMKNVSKKAVKDTAGLWTQYRNCFADISEKLLTAITRSVQVINMYNAPKDPTIRELRPKLVHKILKEAL